MERSIRKRNHLKDDEYIWNVLYHNEIISIPDSQYRTLQFSMFNEIWEERAHRCYISKIPLNTYEARSFYFHHILEKRNYEKYALCKWNIVILSWDVHNSYETNESNVPELVKLKSKLIQLVENHKDLDNSFIYNDLKSFDFSKIIGFPVVENLTKKVSFDNIF